MKRATGSILIVDDSPSEQLLIKEAFRDLGVMDVIHIANDGEEAIAYLKGHGKYSDRQKFQFPTFLLTDLKMPKINGFELLSFLKRSHFIIIPTIVWTMSRDEDDIQHSYLLGANAYHTKPTQKEEFLKLLKKLYEYWAEVQLPDLDADGNLRRAKQSGKSGLFIPPTVEGA